MDRAANGPEHSLYISINFGGKSMKCQSCGSEKLNKLTGQLAVYFSGLKNLSRPVIWFFPELWICLDCGNAGLSVPESELQVLAADNEDASEPVAFTLSSAKVN